MAEVLGRTGSGWEAACWVHRPRPLTHKRCLASLRHHCSNSVLSNAWSRQAVRRDQRSCSMARKQQRHICNTFDISGNVRAYQILENHRFAPSCLYGCQRVMGTCLWYCWRCFTQEVIMVACERVLDHSVTAWTFCICYAIRLCLL
jgi:hypothetical protein